MNPIRVVPNSGNQAVLNGEILQEQQKARYRALPIFEGINWDLIDGAETVAARRRRVATATKKNALRGSETRTKVKAAWARLSDSPIRRRATLIGKELGIVPKRVRTIVKELGLK